MKRAADFESEAERVRAQKIVVEFHVLFEVQYEFATAAPIVLDRTVTGQYVADSLGVWNLRQRIGLFRFDLHFPVSIAVTLIAVHFFIWENHLFGAVAFALVLVLIGYIFSSFEGRAVVFRNLLGKFFLNGIGDAILAFPLFPEFENPLDDNGIQRMELYVAILNLIAVCGSISAYCAPRVLGKYMEAIRLRF